MNNQLKNFLLLGSLVFAGFCLLLATANGRLFPDQSNASWVSVDKLDTEPVSSRLQRSGDGVPAAVDSALQQPSGPIVGDGSGTQSTASMGWQGNPWYSATGDRPDRSSANETVSDNRVVRAASHEQFTSGNQATAATASAAIPTWVPPVANGRPSVASAGSRPPSQPRWDVNDGRSHQVDFFRSDDAPVRGSRLFAGQSNQPSQHRRLDHQTVQNQQVNRQRWNSGVVPVGYDEVNFGQAAEQSAARATRATSVPSAKLVYSNPLPVQRSSVEVESRVADQVRYGKSLARRGAFFAAREEFVNALFTVVEAYDRDSSNLGYSQRLEAALRALEEAKDFGELPRDIDTPQSRQFVLAAHQTAVVLPHEVEQFSRDQLIETYCQYAGFLLEHALGNSRAASQALFAYGKILRVDSKSEPVNSTLALTLFWAASLADAQNHEAVNEIGVSYLANGQLEKAQEMLLRAIKGAPSSVYWDNLAEVHRRKAGVASTAQQRDTQILLAKRADEQARLATTVSGKDASTGVWASPQKFHTDAAVPDLRLGAPRQAQGIAGQPGSVPTVESGSRGPREFLNKLKNWF